MNPFFTRGRGEAREGPATPPIDRNSDDVPTDLLPPPSRNGNVLRIMSPAGERLSIIMENGNLAPPRIPPKSPNRYRSNSRGGSISGATVVSTGTTTLGADEKIRNWSVWSDDGHDDNAMPPGRLARLQRNRHIARRGGWKRLLICLIVSLIIIIAIVVGVLLGTRQHKKNK
jgi:hypothetical protein